MVRAVKRMIGVCTPAVSQFTAHLESVLLWQHDVQQDHVEPSFARAAHRGFAIARDLHAIALDREIFFETERDAGLVFDNENSHHCSATGSSTVKTLPSPGWLSTEISPPCAATIWRAMASPTPVP